MNINSQSLKEKIDYKGIRTSISGFFANSDHGQPKPKTTLEKKHLECRDFEVSKKANPDLIEIFKPLLKFESLDIYVHGSWADNTKTAFSDLDDLIIVKESAFQGEQFKFLKQALIKVEQEFQKLDPLQHHGHWIITDKSLENYDASFMPLFILSDAVLIKGRDKISYKKNNKLTREGLDKNIITTINNVEDFFKLYENRAISIYNLKAFIGSILLLPPMLFQHNGKELDKRTAINNSADLFSGRALACIQWASKCREEWHKIIRSSRFTMFSSALKLFPNPKYARLFSKKCSPNLSSSLYKEWNLESQDVENFVRQTKNYL